MKIKNLITPSLFLLLCWISFTSFAADIQVKVDRTQIELNETFTLIFEASEDPDDSPDFSPLEKDFQVLGTSTSSNMSIINGNYTRSKKWNVTLIALRKGTITIPSISFGSDSSPAYQIEIREPQKSTGKQGEALISELDISISSAYPQQQIIVTQRLLSSSNINAYEFSPLKTSGVEITQQSLGENKQYQTKRGTTPYLVLEQRYAIFPQSAGELTIEPSIASARVAIQGNQRNRSAFDPFRSNTKTLRRSSAQKTISVKPIPQAFKGKHWLAAKDVQLVEEFPESKIFSAGEPVTRTLLLMADGQTASQLPEFINTEVNGLKQYPDKPLLKNNTSDTGITGVQQLKVAIIASTAGKYRLPAISIPWWNTQTNKLEYAKIPARTFAVEPASGAPTTTAPPAQLNTDDTSTFKSTPADITVNPGILMEPDNASNESLLRDIIIWKIISFVLATALAVALFFLWKKTTSQPVVESPPKSNPASLKQALKDLQQACKNANAHASKDALLQWGQALFVDDRVHSLGDISSRVDSALSEKIQSLNSHLYRSHTDPWNCGQLHDLCIKFTDQFNTQQKRSQKKTAEAHLESLYK